MANRLITLEISSFKGMSIGATHYYGKLIPHYDSIYADDKTKRIELQYVIEPKHIELMKNDKNKSPKEIEEDLFWYAVGEKSGRFWLKEDVYKSAIETFKIEFDPKKDYLVEWKTVYMFSKTENKILAGNPKVIEYVNKLESDKEIDFYLRYGKIE